MPDERAPRRYLTFQGRTAKFAVPSDQVRRVLAREEAAASVVYDLRFVLELNFEAEAARVLEIETAGEKRLFMVSAPLEFIQRAELTPLPPLLRVRGAGRFLAAALIDDTGSAVLVIDSDNLGHLTTEEMFATKEEAS